MISSEKKIGRSTSSAASRIVSSTLSWCAAVRRTSSACTMCSTMTSVPSTMMPKSSAPRLSRFAGIPLKCMQMNANSSDSGIVMAVSSAARTLPRNRNSTARTMISPSSSVWVTVCSVLLTRSVRS